MKKMPAPFAAAVLLLSASALLPAGAQQGNPGFTTPASAAPAVSAEPNPQDRLYVQLVGQGGLAEVALARAADGRAAHEGVKRFARRMVDDHGRANARLADAAGGVKLVLPSQPSAEQQAAQARLEGLDGAAFDAAYLDHQRVTHQKTVQLLLWELNSGQTPALQQHAADSLPVVLDHLEHVQYLQAELLGAAHR